MKRQALLTPDGMTEASLKKVAKNKSLQGRYIVALISWLYAKGHRFPNPPALKVLEYKARSEEGLPDHVRKAIDGAERVVRHQAFLEFFDAIPEAERPPRVTYAGNPAGRSPVTPDEKRAHQELMRAKNAERKARVTARQHENARRKAAGLPSVAAEERAAQGISKKKKKAKAIAYKPSNEFLSSRAWLELRYRVLEHYGARCMCCGATKADGAVIQVDHIKPRSLFPELALEFSNMQVLCMACNVGKSNKFDTDWRNGPREKATPLDDEYRRIMGG